MERMTNKYNGENILLCGYCDGDQCNKEDCAAECPCKCEQDAIDRLADYEYAEEQGLLVRLPCKVGDHVFRVNVLPNGEKVLDTYPEYVVHEVRIGFNTKLSVFAHRIVDGRIEVTYYEVFEERDFGRILFPSLEEAEAALAKEREP